ncbi:hypothetical protein CFC21_003047 [Triticum aestivum]|uniref:Uncharacterized protein n=1 Tax=Triticum aestivum TaxID=4565 RepID=A0A3B5Y2X4_WHEAT|nr:hypothetical protein CFC21_003047 [Triticum aestivum]
MVSPGRCRRRCRPKAAGGWARPVGLPSRGGEVTSGRRGGVVVLVERRGGGVVMHNGGPGGAVEVLEQVGAAQQRALEEIWWRRPMLIRARSGLCGLLAQKCHDWPLEAGVLASAATGGGGGPSAMREVDGGLRQWSRYVQEVEDGVLSLCDYTDESPARLRSVQVATVLMGVVFLLGGVTECVGIFLAFP